MRKGLTEVVFILDRSGSMSGLETDTIGGYNSMLLKQKQEEGEAIITTDGMENASRWYSYEKVKKMVEKKKKKCHWEFIFLGANIDAVEVAGRFGVAASRAVRYECDSAGTALNLDVMSKMVSCARKCDCAEDMADFFDDEEVLAPIREDYKKRHRV